MRLFIAIDFPKNLRDEIFSSTELLRKQFPQVAWTKRENIHLTVKFLGYIKDSLLEKIKDGIEDGLAGIKQFNLSFDQLGFFAREQLIIWLGASTPVELKSLVKNLDEAMEKIGFRKEKRKFTPHITIGRGKRLDAPVMEKIKYEIDSTEFTPPKSFRVSEIVLVESVLTPKGPIYEKVRSFSLRASG